MQKVLVIKYAFGYISDLEFAGASLGYTPPKLDDVVNQLLEEGFVMYGSAQLVKNDAGLGFHCAMQQMVKYRTINPEGNAVAESFN